MSKYLFEKTIQIFHNILKQIIAGSQELARINLIILSNHKAQILLPKIHSISVLKLAKFFCIRTLYEDPIFM